MTLNSLNAKIPHGPLKDKWHHYCANTRLVSPKNKRKYHILVVGSGLAGASAASSLAELGFTVSCFCLQDSPRRAHSIAAQGGMNAAKNYCNDGDNVYRLFYDTIKGGDFRSREANVYRLAQLSLPIIDHCVAQGIPFARDYGGMLDNRSFGGALVAVKANGENIPAVIAAAEKAWNNHSPAFPFTYQFLDERLDRLYQSEERQGRIFSLFAAMAIFIACLGMFGLSAFAASVRTKEIGIRKVLGASVASIIGLLSKDFLKLVLLAFVIAIPFAWYFVDDWLNSFAYRINIQWWVFALTGITAIAIAFLTVSIQSVKAALANPVNSLKNE